MRFETYEQARDAARAAWKLTSDQLVMPLDEASAAGSCGEHTGADASSSGHDHGRPQPASLRAAASVARVSVEHPGRGRSTTYSEEGTYAD